MRKILISVIVLASLLGCGAEPGREGGRYKAAHERGAGDEEKGIKVGVGWYRIDRLSGLRTAFWV
jgi:hypothetical protein